MFDGCLKANEVDGQASKLANFPAPEEFERSQLTSISVDMFVDGWEEEKGFERDSILKEWFIEFPSGSYAKFAAFSDGIAVGYDVRAEFFDGSNTLKLKTYTLTDNNITVGVAFAKSGNITLTVGSYLETFQGDVSTISDSATIRVVTQDLPDTTFFLDGSLCAIRYSYEELYSVKPIEDAEWPLGAIVKEVCKRAGVNESMIDVSELYGEKDIVQGCFATPEDDAFTLIEELAMLYQFDPCNFDGAINFLKRGREPVAVISTDELIDDGRDIDKRTRQDAIEVPQILNLEYYDIDGGLTPDKQISDRSLDIRSKDEKKVETAVILTADQAAQMVVINHKVTIEEQNGGYEFSLCDEQIQLTTGDVIMLDGIRQRIVSVEIDEGEQKYKTKLDRKAAFTSEIKGVPATQPITPDDEKVGASVYEFLDLPILSDSDDRLLFYSAINGYGNWRGAVTELSLDGGTNYIDSESGTTPSIMGYLTIELASHQAEIPDRTNTLRVRLIKESMTLENAGLTEMLNRKNLCVIGDEIVNFGEADEIEPGLWEISFMLRGRKGTTPQSWATGTRFVMLRRALLPTVYADTYLLRQFLTFRTTSIGSNQPSSVKGGFLYGWSQRERAPAYLDANRVGGSIEISWIGVGRIGSGGRVSQSQHWRGYRVYVNSVAQPDQIESSITVTDPGGAVTIEVAQVNQFTGAGPVARIELDG